jgi:aspartate kinase
LSSGNSSLLRAAEEALKPQSRLYLDIVNAIRDDHIQAVRQQVRSRDIIDALESEIEAECRGLASFLGAAQVGLAHFPVIRRFR